MVSLCATNIGWGDCTSGGVDTGVAIGALGATTVGTTCGTLDEEDEGLGRALEEEVSVGGAWRITGKAVFRPLFLVAATVTP